MDKKLKVKLKIQKYIIAIIGILFSIILIWILEFYDIDRIIEHYSDEGGWAILDFGFILFFLITGIIMIIKNTFYKNGYKDDSEILF
jgi:hypothetical protein